MKVTDWIEIFRKFKPPFSPIFFRKPHDLERSKALSVYQGNEESVVIINNLR